MLLLVAAWAVSSGAAQLQVALAAGGHPDRSALVATGRAGLQGQTGRSSAVRLRSGAFVGTVRRSGNRLDLSWPSAAAHFMLEYTEDLAAGGWTEARNPRVVADEAVSVTIKPSGSARLYRLRKP
jgi:hypothetical protein